MQPQPHRYPISRIWPWYINSVKDFLSINLLEICEEIYFCSFRCFLQGDVWQVDPGVIIHKIFHTIMWSVCYRNKDLYYMVSPNELTLPLISKRVCWLVSPDSEMILRMPSVIFSWIWKYSMESSRSFFNDYSKDSWGYIDDIHHADKFYVIIYFMLSYISLRNLSMISPGIPLGIHTFFFLLGFL